MKSQPPTVAPPSAPYWITYVSLATAGLAALLLLFTVVQKGDTDKKRATADETRRLRTELDKLRKELAELRRLAATAVRLGAGGRLGIGKPADTRTAGQPQPIGTAPGRALQRPPSATAVPARRPPSVPRYVRFKVPDKALTVRQLSDGSLSVTNTDPSLAGRNYVIRAETEDGRTVNVTITVPPPR